MLVFRRDRGRTSLHLAPGPHSQFGLAASVASLDLGPFTKLQQAASVHLTQSRWSRPSTIPTPALLALHALPTRAAVLSFNQLCHGSPDGAASSSECKSSRRTLAKETLIFRPTVHAGAGQPRRRAVASFACTLATGLRRQTCRVLARPCADASVRGQHDSLLGLEHRGRFGRQ